MARFHLNYFQDNMHIAHLVFASTNLSYWYEYEKAYDKVKESGSALARIIRDGQRTREIRDDLNMRVINHIYFGHCVPWLLTGCTDYMYISCQTCRNHLPRQFTGLSAQKPLHLHNLSALL